MSSYIPIASTTLGSNTGTVEFSSIPTTLNGKTLRDLVLVCRVNASGTGGNIIVRTNNLSGSTQYQQQRGSGNGDTTSAQFSNGNAFYITDSTFGTSSRLVLKMDIFDFATTNKFKNALWRTDSSTHVEMFAGGVNGSTAAITSLQIIGVSTNLAANSTFELYGIEG